MEEKKVKNNISQKIIDVIKDVVFVLETCYNPESVEMVTLKNLLEYMNKITIYEVLSKKSCKNIFTQSDVADNVIKFSRMLPVVTLIRNVIDDNPYVKNFYLYYINDILEDTDPEILKNYDICEDDSKRATLCFMYLNKRYLLNLLNK